ncbi:MAG: hypothetical protein AABX11_06950 [Nanoarchaeota archaeon]|mgnify:FL=1
MIRNKRGEEDVVLWEYLKIVLAVIVILGLVYLGAQLYGLFKGKSDLAKAGVHIDNIVSKIEGLSEGKNIVYALYSPNGYALSAWPYNQMIPNQCKSKNWANCVCLCKRRDGILGPVQNSPENVLKLCNEEGICKQVKSSVLVGGSFSQQYPLEVNKLLKDGTGINISLKDGRYYVIPEEVKK